MGTGIAQVIVQSGLAATVVETSEELASATGARVGATLDRLVDKGRLDAAEREAAGSRLTTTTNLDVAAEADFVIETVTEDLAIKQTVMERLDALCAPEVVITTNTSQFSISAIARATQHPERVIGAHWFNPAPIMRLIEVVRGTQTADWALDATLAAANAFGKETVVCKRDTQGFITSRLITILAMEAMRIVEEGIADPSEVDKACELGFNHAMGPLATADASGLDTLLKSSLSLTDHYGSRFIAPQTLRRLVDAGHYGRKTGRGFSEYGDRRP